MRYLIANADSNLDFDAPDCVALALTDENITRIERGLLGASKLGRGDADFTVKEADNSQLNCAFGKIKDEWHSDQFEEQGWDIVESEELPVDDPIEIDYFELRFYPLAPPLDGAYDILAHDGRYTTYTRGMSMQWLEANNES